MPPLTDQAGLTAASRAELEEIVSRHDTLERVLTWAKGESPPRTIEEVLTQDEYTHDVILPFRHGLYLVYDTT